MKQYWDIVRTEFTAVFRDRGLMLILFGAMFIYGTLYPLIYAPEVVRELPVAVVDLDVTRPSRELTRKLDATPQTAVAYMAGSLEEAKTLFLDRAVYGVMLIPDGYEKDLLSGVQAHVSLYADGSYFLLYGNFLEAVSDVVLNAGAEVKVETLMTGGLNYRQAEWIAQPVDYKVESLFNPYDGYATALMPAVLLLIMQQLLLIGIGMAGGTWYEQRAWDRFRDRFRSRAAMAMAVVLAKAMAYLMLYAPVGLFFFGVQYRLFGYPMNGYHADLLWLMLPYLLACIFLGITIGALCKKRETSIMLLACSSVFFLMLSGISWPKEGMPGWMFALGQLVPASSGIEGLVRIRTMGGTWDNVGGQAITLWSLVGIYGSTAVLAIKMRLSDIATAPDRPRDRPTDYNGQDV